MRKIVLNPIGGLANRMRCIASGLALAAQTGADYDVVWAVNDELAARFDDIFLVPENLTGRIKYPSGLSYALNYSIPRRRNMFVSALTLKRFSAVFLDAASPFREMMKTSDTPLLATANFGVKNIYVQAGTIFHPFTQEFYRSLFRLNAEMQRRVEEKVKLLGKDYVGLHIRRTDNVMSIKHSPDSLFLSEIEKILQAVPGTKFYLATDSEETKEKFKQTFGDETIICSPRPASRKSLAGIKDAVEELFTLANASQIIGSFYSSFSEAASLLGSTPLRQLTINR
ncbi:MAG: hypothetical protein J6C81_06895 [Muribaculaceae bacterium]|nr:hypothetical protein [Muribaculaceae bacterium]